MKRTFVFLLLTVIIIGGTAWAETYSLQECIQRALDTNPSVISARNSVSTAGATVWQQLGQFLPSASFSLSSSQTYRGPINRLVWVGEDQVEYFDPNWAYQKSYSGGFNFNQTLFNGLQNVWNFKGSKASKRQSEQQFIITKSNITFTVKTDYYLVLKAKKDLSVAQEAVNRSEEILKLFQEKYDLGSASLSEVLKQKVQYGNDRLTQVTAQQQLEVRMDQLAVDIGVDPKSEFDVEDIQIKRETPEDVDAMVAEALKSHPSVLAAKASTDASKYDVRSAWGWYMPSLTLGYSYSWGNNYFDNLSKDVFGLKAENSGASLRLSLGLSLFDGFTRERNMSRAKASLSNARYQQIYTRNSVIKAIEDAHLGVRLADQTLAVTEETQRAAQEDFDLVQAKYNLGAAAQWELLDAQVSLSQAQFNTISAEFDYNLALAKLQNAMGK